MHHTSESVEALVEQLSKLPTIGRKTAQRLAAYVLKMSREEVVEMAEALVAVKDRVRHCPVCYNVTDAVPCAICRSARRDHSVVCVVEEPNDVMAFERTGEYRGVYHVLGGAISPIDGIGPDDLHIGELVARVTAKNAPNGDGEARDVAEPSNTYGGAGSDAPTSDSLPSPSGVRPAPEIGEVILAMNPNVEGDTTAYYISQLLSPFGVRVTRIARGLPIGGDLEYADEATLSRALEGRGAL